MPKKNVYVSEELDELINAHEGPVPFSQIVTTAIEEYLGQRVCPTCKQPVKIAKVKSTSVPVENAHTIKQMEKMPWSELKGYAREIDDGTIATDTRNRATLIQSIVASTGQTK